jgi:hypothetical protein
VGRRREHKQTAQNCVPHARFPFFGCLRDDTPRPGEGEGGCGPYCAPAGSARRSTGVGRAAANDGSALCRRYCPCLSRFCSTRALRCHRRRLRHVAIVGPLLSGFVFSSWAQSRGRLPICPTAFSGSDRLFKYKKVGWKIIVLFESPTAFCGASVFYFERKWFSAFMKTITLPSAARPR